MLPVNYYQDHENNRCTVLYINVDLHLRLLLLPDSRHFQDLLTTVLSGTCYFRNFAVVSAV